VPEILHQASDDQIALAICFGAVVVSGLIMHFSLHVGRLTGRIRLHETPQQGELVLQEARELAARELAIRERAA
jgi:hypothetical protein